MFYQKNIAFDEWNNMPDIHVIKRKEAFTYVNTSS